VRETRTEARNALYQVELSTASTVINQTVHEIFRLAKSIKDSETPREESIRRNEVEERLDEVIRLTREELGVQDIP
jgi:hypothetical protein